MSTLLAPQQSDRSAWHDTRVGRFTASTIGALMTEPRSKADKEAGKWSETAKMLINQKAVERVTGRPVHTSANFSMRRGTLLEHAAVYLLSKHWQPIDGSTLLLYGDNAGATPDGLLRDGSTVDIKSPESEVQLFEFGDQVPEGDWEAMLAWDRTYAWQIATQALAAGTTRATLIYFSDRLAMRQWEEGERETCNAIMEAVGEKLLQETGQIYDYHIQASSDGYGWVIRSFEIPAEAMERIETVIERASEERNRVALRYAEQMTAGVSIEGLK